MAASIEHHQLPLPRIEGARLLIVVAPYYRQIAEGLVAGAQAVAAKSWAIPPRTSTPPTPRQSPRTASTPGG